LIYSEVESYPVHSKAAFRKTFRKENTFQFL
jgi:hypothetical protein